MRYIAILAGLVLLLMILSIVFFLLICGVNLRRAEPLQIKMKRFDPSIPMPEEIDIGDWIDLRAAEDVMMQQGDLQVIRLGIGMILPEGYEAIIAPRSSTPKNFGILCANSIGVIDNSYSGDGDEWCFPAYAIRDTFIHKGERICQFRIVKNAPDTVIEEVYHLRKANRGGLGSTGKM